MYLEKLKNLQQNDKICLLGLGQENRQFLDWLVNVFKFEKSNILLADQRDLADFVNMGFDPENIFAGDNYLSVLENPQLEYVFKSPGIWSKIQELEDFRSLKGDDRVLSNLVFFIEKFKDQIIGITGTKGKSTTCGIVNHLINKDTQYTSYYCGNTTNISPYTFWDILDADISDDVFFVIELSSFQLEDLGYSKTSPKISGITNYYIDHLDQHKTKKEYWASKDNIFIHQDNTGTIVFLKDFQERLGENTINNQNIITKENVENIIEQYKIPELRGYHNYQNLSIALELIKIIGINAKPEFVKKEMKSFSNLPHRQQLVKTISTEILLKDTQKKLNINFIDDGAATEPEAVRAGVLSYSELGDYLWLIVDGLDKGGDLSNLIEAILDVQKKNQLHKVNYCGEVGEHLLNCIYQKMGIDIKASNEDFKQSMTANFESLAKIRTGFTKWLEELVNNFDSINDNQSSQAILNKDEYNLNVLFSPCGTSFKDFTNYIQRSNWWIESIQNIKKRRAR